MLHKLSPRPHSSLARPVQKSTKGTVPVYDWWPVVTEKGLQVTSLCKHTHIYIYKQSQTNYCQAHCHLTVCHMRHIFHQAGMSGVADEFSAGFTTSSWWTLMWIDVDGHLHWDSHTSIIIYKQWKCDYLCQNYESL